ncbi:MAG: PepSY domain-containing protein [Gemmataceae bacterium]
MKLQILNRKVHYWAAIVVALPALVIIVTGLILQLKKEWHWVQPAEIRGGGKFPTIGFERILEVCRQVPEAEIHDWADINRLDVRPSRGMVKVRARNDWEIQIDIQTGSILQVAYRRSDLIESIHDGSWFHEWAKLGLFLPAAVLLFVMWLTGMYLFWLPIYVRWRRRRADQVRRRL